jgi:hypothetical protein
MITPFEDNDLATAGVPHGCTDGDHVRLCARVCESDEVHRWKSIADEARQAAFSGCMASELHGSQHTVVSSSTPVSSPLTCMPLSIAPTMASRKMTLVLPYRPLVKSETLAGAISHQPKLNPSRITHKSRYVCPSKSVRHVPCPLAITSGNGWMKMDDRVPPPGNERFASSKARSELGLRAPYCCLRVLTASSSFGWDMSGRKCEFSCDGDDTNS